MIIRLPFGYRLTISLHNDSSVSATEKFSTPPRHNEHDWSFVPEGFYKAEAKPVIEGKGGRGGSSETIIIVDSDPNSYGLVVLSEIGIGKESQKDVPIKIRDHVSDYDRSRPCTVFCQRKDGIICPDDSCDIETGVYVPHKGE